jgi:hypothetical protein
MPREVDPKRTRKALRRVRRLAALQTDAETPPDYSGWEKEFLTEVEQRLDKFGSAFADLGKGRPDEALSTLQAQKLREIEQKAKGGKNDDGKLRPRSSFKRKQPPWAKDKSGGDDT